MIDLSHTTFDQLTLDQWYAISGLRQRVFIVEQDCPYLDADGRDPEAHHIFGQDDLRRIVAYARVIHPSNQLIPIEKFQYFTEPEIEIMRSRVDWNGSTFFLPALGRVVLDPLMRGKGQGDVLMSYALSCCIELFPGLPVFISAQQPLHDFYGRHGFRQSGPPYLEDEIPHIPMVLE